MTGLERSGEAGHRALDRVRAAPEHSGGDSMTRPLEGLDGWTVRGCTLHDVPAILAITRASDIAALGEPDWSVDEIVATLTAPAEDPAVDSWLAAGPDGEPVAWAYVDNPQRGVRDNVEVYGWPGRGEPAYGPLLDLAVARAVARARRNGFEQFVLRAGTLAAETALVSVLESRGFSFVKRHARMGRPLTGDERAAFRLRHPPGPPRRAAALP